MPDPVWTQQYNLQQTPEQNGFTRTLSGSPTVTTQTSGPAANRRVEVNSNNGDCVFLTSQVPALDATVGATAESVCSCSGAGNAGFELTFLSRAFLVMVFENRIDVTICRDGAPQPSDEQSIPTASNGSNITLRFTTDGSSNLRVYRNGVLILGPTPLPACVKPFQRVLWWGEAGGTQIFRAFRYYIGGAVEPG